MRSRRAKSAVVSYAEKYSDDEVPAATTRSTTTVSTRSTRISNRTVSAAASTSNDEQEGSADDEESLGIGSQVVASKRHARVIADEEDDEGEGEKKEEDCDDDLFCSDEEREVVKKLKSRNMSRAATRSESKSGKSSSSTSTRKRHSKRKAPAKKKRRAVERNVSDRRSSRAVAATSAVYAEASSDDEFARDNFMLESGDESGESDGDDAGGSDCDDSDSESAEKVTYHIERIVAVRTLSAPEWCGLCDNMNTREVTRGSVWLQLDEEYLSASPEAVTKYLIKWVHASYLHVSWEKEADLLELASASAKAALQRFTKRLLKHPGVDVLNFGDITIPAAYKTVERVLDVEDSAVDDIHTVQFETTPLPTGDADSDVLHGPECFVVVKWESLGYSDATFESVEDLRSAGVQYEKQMRAFYRREQQPPATGKSAPLASDLDTSAVQSETAPTFPGGLLRDYQWDGVRWLLFNWTQHRNSILADEMGLGKTIQTACFLDMLRSTFHQRGPFLIIAPLSTVVNWQREISAWTNLDVMLYHGSAEDRHIAREHEFFYAAKDKSFGYKVEVVITTPETAAAFDSCNGLRNRRELSKIRWSAIVIDEAHKIKNYDSKFTTIVREEYKYHSCLLLTGTPLQNKIDELWTLLNFVDRKVFADREGFTAEYGELKTTAQLDSLQSRLKPFLLRREKEHVEKTVPPKQEVLIEVELTAIQKQYYRAIYEQKTEFLFKKEAKDGPSLSNLAMELRKCCLHLFLIKGADKELHAHFQGESTVDVLIKASAKMTLLDKLLPKLKSEGHRVLIFSQFRIMLDIIEDYLELKQLRYERVDGAVTGKDRQAAIDRFASDDGIFVMLLSTRAGGVGINLTQADTVIIFDSDWNPQNDIQAIARAHRIGQMKSVMVYRLLTKNTYEQAMFRAASVKLGLDYAVMHNMNHMEGIASDRSAQNFSALSRRELENLLKYGAYGAFAESSSDDVSMGDETIEQILSRSETIVREVSDTDKSAEPKVSFSKASFVTDSNASDNCVSVNDPDFWNKVVGLAIKESNESLGSKRKCRDDGKSYKEPGLHVKGTLLSEAGYSSDSSEECKPSKKTKAQGVEWTEANLNKLLAAMLGKGYCNWAELKKDAKLKWSISEIALGCRLLIVSLLCAAAKADAAADASAALVTLLKKFKVARAAVVACQQTFVSPLHSQYVAGLPSETAPETDVLAGYVRVISETNAASVVSLAIQVDSTPERIVLDGSEVAFDALAAMALPWPLDKDCVPSLQHLEELFEVHILCNLLHTTEIEAEAVKDGLNAVLSDVYVTGNLITPVSWWTAEHDAQMLRAVPSVGLPDSKKKLTAIQTAMFPENNAPENFPQSYPEIMKHVRNVLNVLRGETPVPSQLPYSTTILRVLAKLGKPHDLYVSVLCAEPPLRRNAAAYLISWQQFLKECGSPPSLDEARLRQFMAVMYAQLDSSGATPDDKSITRGLLTGLTPKAIAEACAKADVMYRVRTTIATREDEQLTLDIQQRAQGTGAAVPPYARDKSMPVWWTTAHDIKLLKLTSLHGLHQWKKVLAAESQSICKDGEVDQLSIVDAPMDFEMPLRENGLDWVLTMTPKSAEKRLAHLLKSVDACACVQSLPQSPPRVFAVVAPTKAQAKPASKPKVEIPRPAAFNWTSAARASVDNKAAPVVTPVVIDLVGALVSSSAEAPVHGIAERLGDEAPSAEVAVSVSSINNGEKTNSAIGSELSAEPICSSALELQVAVECEVQKETESLNVAVVSAALSTPTGITQSAAAESDFVDIIVSSISAKSTATAENAKAGANKGALTEPKKRKAGEPKGTTKKPAAPSAGSGSILSFFTRKPTATVISTAAASEAGKEAPLALEVLGDKASAQEVVAGVVDL